MLLSRFALLVCGASLLHASGSPPEVPRARAALAQLPLRFEANRGQWNPAVRYAARAGGYGVFLTDRGPALSLAGSRRVDISFVHSNPSPAVEPLDRLPSRTNYFLGRREHWKTGIPNYSRVRYRAVYKGIDLVYYGNQSRLEYDFVLQPGADPSAIRLKFRGAGHLVLTPEGDLEIGSGDTAILQKKPSIYQVDARTSARREIAGRYVLLARDAVGVRLEHYDRTRPLVIDPVLLYSTYLGGSGADSIAGAKLDAKGLLYIVGTTANGDLPATDSAFNAANSGFSDVFLAVLDTTADGGFALKYFSYLGGSQNDTATAMDIDSAGNVYITGTTASSNFPLAGPAIQSAESAGSLDGFVTKLNPAASGTDSLFYSTYLGGGGEDVPKGIAVDKNGFIYVIGATKSSDFPVTASAYAGVQWGPQDAFLTKIDTGSSALAYSTYLGGESADDGRAIAVGPDGLVYFAATTFSTQFPQAGVQFRDAPQGAADIIIGVMDMTKSNVDSLVYTTYFGGSDAEEVRGISLDPSGKLLVTGFTFSTDFPVTADAFQSAPAGNGDVFVARVDPAARPHDFLLYSTYLGGSQGEVAYGIAGDAAGNIYVAGYTLSADFPSTKDMPQPDYGGGIDAFVTKLKPGVAGSAALQYSTFFGAAGIYVANSVALAPDGTVFVAGFGTRGLPSSDNARQAGFGGGSTDGFVFAIGK